MAASLLEIPVRANSPWFATPINLLNVDYVFEFQFNERAALWYLDILDQLESPLVQGIALTTGRDLLRPFRTKVFAGAVLFVYDSTGAQSNPGFDSFGLTHRLLFAQTT